MEATRRDFLGAIACAFAAAKLPCRIPAGIIKATNNIVEVELKLVTDLSKNGFVKLGGEYGCLYLCWGEKGSKPAILGACLMDSNKEDGSWKAIILPFSGTPVQSKDLEISYNV